jgi:hypothetical protein
MIRFEVTGETPEQFVQNAIKAWSVLATGMQRIIAASPPADAPPVETTQMASSATTKAAPGGSSMDGRQPPEIKREPITTNAVKDWFAEVVLAHGAGSGRDLLALVGAKRVTEIDTDAKRAEFMRASKIYVSPAMDDEIPF